jgi:DNA replication protein DnaC
MTTSSPSLNLPRLSNAEYEYVASLTRQSGTPIDACPTCHARRIEVAPGVYGWENGTYRYRGEDRPCDCDTQIALRKHYLLAGIGDQYMRLDWADYHGDPAVKDPVETFLDKWQAFKDNGMGMEFASRNLGVGKTFAATYVGKELIKRGEKVLFTPFLDSVSFDDKALRERLRTTTVLILDEVVPPVSDRQQQFFAGEFEEIIRFRTNFNRVTIMTTNIEPDQLRATFPRVYSLLEAKQIRVLMRGDDARRSLIAEENLELALNNEVRPIT